MEVILTSVFSAIIIFITCLFYDEGIHDRL